MAQRKPTRETQKKRTRETKKKRTRETQTKTTKETLDRTAKSSEPVRITEPQSVTYTIELEEYVGKKETVSVQQPRVGSGRKGPKEEQVVLIKRELQKHSLDIIIPKEAHAVRLGDTLMAPSEIKLHDYLRSFSYFYVEMPFSIIPTSEYIVPLVTLDVTIV